MLARGEHAAETVGFKRHNRFEPAGRKCRMLRESAGTAVENALTRIPADEFLMIGSSMAECYRTRFFDQVPFREEIMFESVAEPMPVETWL